MKNNFTKILALAILLFVAKPLAARLSPDSISVILACTTSDQDKINAIKKLILSEPGVKYVDFCTNHSIFLFTMAGVSQDADAFASKIRKQSNASQQDVYIKEYTFGDIRNTCQSDNAPYGKPKR
jgi:hypothetical protein